MADANTAKDKSFQGDVSKQPTAPVAPKAPAAPKEPKAPKETKSTEKVDKSFQSDKKTANKGIKVGDTVVYPYKEAEHGKRTSKVYDVSDDTVTILAHDGQKTTIAKDRVELV